MLCLNSPGLFPPQLTDGLITWASVLEVTRIRHQDYTSYRCSSRNALGSDSVLVHLRPPSRPLPPLHLAVSVINLPSLYVLLTHSHIPAPLHPPPGAHDALPFLSQVANVTGEEVWLTWTPNLEGGAPRAYTIRYRPINESAYQVRSQCVSCGLLPLTVPWNGVIYVLYTRRQRMTINSASIFLYEEHYHFLKNSEFFLSMSTPIVQHWLYTLQYENMQRCSAAFL